MVKIKRKQYTPAFKLQVMDYAESINPDTNEPYGSTKAGVEFGVGDRLVREWCSKRRIIEVTPRDRRKLKPMKAKFPILEEHLRRWVLRRRAEKRRVRF